MYSAPKPAPWFRDGTFSDWSEVFADATTLADTVTRSAATKTAVVRGLSMWSTLACVEYRPNRSTDM
jgi:hypothetical protein